MARFQKRVTKEKVLIAVSDINALRACLRESFSDTLTPGKITVTDLQSQRLG